MPFHTTGTASMSRAVSSYVDQLVDHKMSTFLNGTVPMNLPFLAEYADFFSLFIVVIITLLLAFGVKESSYVNMLFTFVNLATVATAFVTSLIYGEWGSTDSKPERGRFLMCLPSSLVTGRTGPYACAYSQSGELVPDAGADPGKVPRRGGHGGLHALRLQGCHPGRRHLLLRIRGLRLHRHDQ